MKKPLVFACFITFLFSGVFCAYASDTFIDSGVGSDFYLKVDKWAATLENAIVQKRITEWGTLNNINFFCGVGFLQWNAFNKDDFTKIANGDTAPIFDRLGDNGMGLSTDSSTIVTLQNCITDYYSHLQQESSQSLDSMASIGEVGLYTDGDTNNSDFDLLSDLQQINSVIFSQPIPYAGLVNNDASAIAGILASFGNNPIINGTAANTTFSTPNSMANNADNSSASASNIGAGNVCSTGILLDSGVLADINAQSMYGSNAQSSVQGEVPGLLIPGKFSHPSLSAISNGDESGLFDSPNCGGVFCITIDFLKYTRNVLFGGKTYSVESIVDKHLGIANKYVSSSFTQAKFTKNFFELSLQDLNLPSMIHLWVQVSSLPAPLLNVQPNDGSTASGSAQANFDKRYKDVLNATLTAYGIDPQHENALTSDFTDKAISECVWLDTNACLQKTQNNPTGNFIANTPSANAVNMAIRTQTQNTYSQSMDTDFLQLSAFTKSLHTDVSQLLSVIRWMHDIPKWS